MKIYTEAKRLNHFCRKIFFLTCTLLTSAWTRASDYYVKTGSTPATGADVGSAGNPGTLNQLVAYLSGYESSEALYVYIASGTYTVPKNGIVINTKQKGNNDRWNGIDVRFVPMDDANPPVFGVRQSMFALSNFVKVTVDNVIIKGTSNYASNVAPFVTTNSARLILRNTTVRDFNLSLNYQLANGRSGNGLFAFESANLYLINCVITKNTVLGTASGKNKIDNISLIYFPYTQVFIDGTLFLGNTIKTNSAKVIPTMISSLGSNLRVLNSTFKENTLSVPTYSSVSHLPAISYAQNPSVYINFINNTVTDNKYADESGKKPLDIYSTGASTGFTKVINNSLEKGVRIENADTKDMVVNNIIFGNDGSERPIVADVTSIRHNAFNYGGSGWFEEYADPNVQSKDVNFGATIDKFLSDAETVTGKVTEARKLIDFNGHSLLKRGGKRRETSSVTEYAAFAVEFDGGGSPCSGVEALVPDLNSGCASCVAAFLQYDQLGRLRPTEVSLGAWDFVPVQPNDDHLTTQLDASVIVKPTANDVLPAVGDITVTFGAPTDLAGKALGIPAPAATELHTQYGKYQHSGSGRDVELSYTAPAYTSEVTTGDAQIPSNVIVFPYTASDGTDARSGRVMVFVVENAGGKLIFCTDDPYNFALRKLPYTAFQIYDDEGNHLTNDPFYQITAVNKTTLQVKPRIVTDQDTDDTNDDTKIVFPMTSFTIQGNAVTDTGPVFRVPNME